MKTCLVEFIVSLLTSEDSSIVKRLLEVTGNIVLADLRIRCMLSRVMPVSDCVAVFAKR